MQINVCLSIALCSVVPQSGGVKRSLVSCVNHHHFKPSWFKETTNYKSKNKGRDQTVEKGQHETERKHTLVDVL